MVNGVRLCEWGNNFGSYLLLGLKDTKDRDGKEMWEVPRGSCYLGNIHYGQERDILRPPTDGENHNPMNCCHRSHNLYHSAVCCSTDQNFVYATPLAISYKVNPNLYNHHFKHSKQLGITRKISHKCHSPFTRQLLSSIWFPFETSRNGMSNWSQIYSNQSHQTEPLTVMV